MEFPEVVGAKLNSVKFSSMVGTAASFTICLIHRRHQEDRAQISSPSEQIVGSPFDNLWKHGTYTKAR